MTTALQAQEPHEPLEAFGLRARRWLAGNMPRLDPSASADPRLEVDEGALRARFLQRLLWEGGFAGLCYPREYGGQGLPIDYQRLFDKEADGYELPYLFSMPTHSISGPTILEFGTDQQRHRYIPKFLSGEEMWAQFMSEPSGGSDMAGALTHAKEVQGHWELNGSKIWSSNAFRSDYALCLARTDWDVPKHQGLTMFIVPIKDPSITIRQIEMVDGTREFCEEHFDDTNIPLDHVLGKTNDGWTVALRTLYFERLAMGGSSPYLSVPRRNGPSSDELLDLAIAIGQTDDPDIQRLLGRAEVLSTVHQQLISHVGRGMQVGRLPEAAGALLRLYAGVAAIERANIGLRIAGDGALTWHPNDPGRQFGLDYIARQSRAISGGTIEMARNNISERVLGMPREAAADREVPFRSVRTNQVDR